MRRTNGRRAAFRWRAPAQACARLVNREHSVIALVDRSLLVTLPRRGPRQSDRREHRGSLHMQCGQRRRRQAHGGRGIARELIERRHGTHSSYLGATFWMFRSLVVEIMAIREVLADLTRCTTGSRRFAPTAARDLVSCAARFV